MEVTGLKQENIGKDRLTRKCENVVLLKKIQSIQKTRGTMGYM